MLSSQSEKLAQAQSKQEMVERLEHYLKLAPSVIYTLKLENENSEMVWVSSSVQDILGYTIEEAKELGWWEKNIHQEDKDNAVSGQSLLFEKGSLKREYRFLKKTGTRYGFMIR